jgi:hypothetical protein
VEWADHSGVPQPPPIQEPEQDEREPQSEDDQEEQLDPDPVHGLSRFIVDLNSMEEPGHPQNHQKRAASLRDLTLKAEKSMMLRLTGRHGIGVITENTMTRVDSQSTGTELSSHILVIDRGSSQIIATAIGPEETRGATDFVNAVHLLDGPEPTAPACTL